MHSELIPAASHRLRVKNGRRIICQLPFMRAIRGIIPTERNSPVSGPPYVHKDEPSNGTSFCIDVRVGSPISQVVVYLFVDEFRNGAKCFWHCNTALTIPTC